MSQLLLPPSRARLWWGLAIGAFVPPLLTPILGSDQLRDYPSMYYLLLIAFTAAVGRLAAGGVAVITSALAFDYEFLGPGRTLLLDNASIEVFIAFCVIALALAQLVAWADAARARAESTTARLELLRRVSDALGASIDYEETLRSVGRVLIPELAAWFSVHLVDESTGTIVNAHVDHVDPEGVELSHEVWQQLPPPVIDDEGGVGKVIRTGTPAMFADLTDETLLDALDPIDREQVLLFRKLGLRSVMIVPMLSGDRVVGAIELGTAQSGRRYDADDLDLADDIARRAAVAIENAALYRERQDEVRALQQRLLPRTLPTVPGAEIAARYLPAHESMLVGGDFFDLFPMDGGNWKAVIGDVSGKGAAAAALMGFVRFTIRAVSKEDTKPSDALRKVNTALREEIGEETTFCTAVITRIHPNEEGARLTIAVAGHPLPFAIRSDGTVETAGTPGALLGFLDDVEITDTVVDLRPGDAFLLLTDGVLESSRDPRWADEDLPRLLSIAAGMRPITVVDLIEGSVAAIENRRSDDIALLAIQLPVPVEASVPANPRATRALVIDEALRIVDANTSVLADLGYPRGEITGLDVRDLVVDPGDMERETRPLVADGSWAGEATLRRRDGTSVSYLAESSTLRTKERTLHLALLAPVPAHAAG